MVSFHFSLYICVYNANLSSALISSKYWINFSAYFRLLLGGAFFGEELEGEKLIEKQTKELQNGRLAMVCT
jgi:hypothetical protein